MDLLPFARHGFVKAAQYELTLEARRHIRKNLAESFRFVLLAGEESRKILEIIKRRCNCSLFGSLMNQLSSMCPYAKT